MKISSYKYYSLNFKKCLFLQIVDPNTVKSALCVYILYLYNWLDKYICQTILYYYTINVSRKDVHAWMISFNGKDMY